MAGEGEFPKADGDVLYASEANGLIPIGTILPWVKSLTGVPALSGQFVECNGQTLSDAGSPLNGQVIPNLNGGTYRMLRGASTSGGTGGADTHTLTTAEMPAHSHTIYGYTYAGGQSRFLLMGQTSSGNQSPTENLLSTTGSGNAHNNLPAYYEVVYIMRVK